MFYSKQSLQQSDLFSLGHRSKLYNCMQHCTACYCHAGLHALTIRPVAKGGRAPPPAKPECPPLEQKILQIELFMGCSVGFKYAKNALAHWGRSRRSSSPRPPSRLGRGTPVPMPHPLGTDSHAFGASMAMVLSMIDPTLHTPSEIYQLALNTFAAEQTNTCQTAVMGNADFCADFLLI